MSFTSTPINTLVPSTPPSANFWDSVMDAPMNNQELVDSYGGMLPEFSVPPSFDPSGGFPPMGNLADSLPASVPPFYPAAVFAPNPSYYGQGNSLPYSEPAFTTNQPTQGLAPATPRHRRRAHHLDGRRGRNRGHPLRSPHRQAAAAFNSPRQKKRSRFTEAALLTAVRAAIEVNPYHAKHGDKLGKWVLVLRKVQANGYCTGTSVQTLRNKINEMVEGHLEPRNSAGIAMSREMSQSTEVALGALLDNLHRKREKATQDAEERLEVKARKEEENEIGGAAIRDNSLCAMRPRASRSKKTTVTRAVSPDVDSGTESDLDNDVEMTEGPSSPTPEGPRTPTLAIGLENTAPPSSQPRHTAPHTPTPIPAPANSGEIENAPPPRRVAGSQLSFTEEVMQLIKDSNKEQGEKVDRLVDVVEKGNREYLGMLENFLNRQQSSTT